MWVAVSDRQGEQGIEGGVVLPQQVILLLRQQAKKNGALFLKKQSCSQQEDWTINKIEVLSIHVTPYVGCSRVPFQKAKEGKMYFSAVKGVEYCPSFENNQNFTLCHSITLPLYFFKGLKLPYWTSVDKSQLPSPVMFLELCNPNLALQFSFLHKDIIWRIICVLLWL